MGWTSQAAAASAQDRARYGPLGLSVSRSEQSATCEPPSLRWPTAGLDTGRCIDSACSAARSPGWARCIHPWRSAPREPAGSDAGGRLVEDALEVCANHGDRDDDD